MAMGHINMRRCGSLFFFKVGQAVAHMEGRAAWTRECACTRIKRGSKAGQLTQIAYVEDEAVKPMARVSMCEEPTRCHAKDDYPRSHIDTPVSL